MLLWGDSHVVTSVPVLQLLWINPNPIIDKTFHRVANISGLFGTFMESKSFQSSKTLDGKIRYDREGSNWDHFRYGSFLEPTAWIRVSSRVSSDPKNNISTLHIEISVVTERISSLEEEHPPRPQHIEAVESLLGEFELSCRDRHLVKASKRCLVGRISEDLHVYQRLPEKVRTRRGW